jgi:hypothetical protein
MLVGSTAGAYAPSLWGVSSFSFTSALLSAVGGIIGIWIGFKLSNY